MWSLMHEQIGLCQQFTLFNRNIRLTGKRLTVGRMLCGVVNLPQPVEKLQKI